MASLAENLKPPFYAAILNEGERHSTFVGETTPIDEMVSIAPGQPGFLGLETTRDKQGKRLTISYWRDLEAERAWEYRGDAEIRKLFAGAALEDACHIRVSKIEHKVGRDKSLRADVRHIPHTDRLASLSALVFAAFPSIASRFRHEAVQ